MREKKECVSVYLQNVCMCVCVYMCAHMFHAMIGARTNFLLLFQSDTHSATATAVTSSRATPHPTLPPASSGGEAALVQTILTRMGANRAELKLL